MSAPKNGPSVNQRCARDSDWCDGVMCREHGLGCPHADVPWACPTCGSTGYVVGGILRCGNAGCANVDEFDPATGERIYDAR